MATLVYLGTPDAAVAPLRTLVEAGHDVALVVSRADKRRGRGSQLVPSPVKAAALELGLPVTDQLAEAAEVGAELGVVVAYGRIIPAATLQVLPMVNLHFSLLPRWRGAAPVERAILAGDRQTGVCLMAVDVGLDTGDIYAEAAVDIDERESAEELRARLVTVGCGLLRDHLSGGRAGLPPAHPQQGEPTYAEKVQPAEHELHWDRPADELDRVVRLGRAWTTFRGRRLRVVQAEPGGAAMPETVLPGTLVDGVAMAGGGTRLRLLRVQPEGKQPMTAGDWYRGIRQEPGERLGG